MRLSEDTRHSGMAVTQAQTQAQAQAAIVRLLDTARDMDNSVDIRLAAWAELLLRTCVETGSEVTVSVEALTARVGALEDLVNGK